MNMNKNNLSNKVNLTTKNNSVNVNVNGAPKNGKKFSKIFMIIMVIIAISIISIIIYIIVCAIHYNNEKCYVKKPFHKYIFDFSDNKICEIDTEPIPEKPKEPIKKQIIDMLPRIEKRKEVFHINNQDYTYEQSKCKCESYGGTLATKAQLIDAYNNGANWCTYGWTDSQTAFYPVQKCEYDKMVLANERLPDKEKKFCGMPGINGGYFPNSLLKFGVNCYGVKPEGETNKPKPPVCPPMNFCKLENNFQSSHKLDTDVISSFNNDQWNMNP